MFLIGKCHASEVSFIAEKSDCFILSNQMVQYISAMS
jgi:hypothetical protein